MMQSSRVSFLGLLILAGSASATTVGPVKGAPVSGRPLEVNVPFALDRPTDRACASASVRYGNAPVSRSIIDVQGQGLKRNLLVTSPVHVNESTVTVNVRVGCGAKSVTRRFTLVASAPAPKASPIASTNFVKPLKPAGSGLAVREEPRPGGSSLVARAEQKSTAAEPLFPPAVHEARAQEPDAPKGETGLSEELHKARTESATAAAQLAATRKELAAILDVQRRTWQTLITAEHQVKDAKSQVARMQLVLKSVAAALALAAAGFVWFEFNRVASRMRRAREEQPQQEPTILSAGEVPA